MLRLGCRGLRCVLRQQSNGNTTVAAAAAIAAKRHAPAGAAVPLLLLPLRPSSASTTLRSPALTSTRFLSSCSLRPIRLNPAAIRSFVPCRHCSSEFRTMDARDRDTLPAVAKPSHYHLSLFNLQLGGSWAYDGKVTIDAKIVKPTSEIVLNVKAIKIQTAEIKVKDAKSLQSSDISYDETSERATIKFSEEIQPANSVLTIDFTGSINNHMSGFCRAKYKPIGTPSEGTPKEGENHFMMSTQFEACDARQAFPCFDEPNLKATFDFEIEVPKDLVALSNMPVKSTRDGSTPGRHFVSFERTPVMSTYLLAWAVGDFEYVEAFTERKYNGKSIPVRVYTTRGLKEQARFALDCAHRTVDYFSEIFEIDYPLPKSDLLAVHEFAMGAMENWGLVTYRTTAVLFEEGKSDARYKNRVAYVVAHELAHQWFGNLVTMDWWNELWLNEGFATWVGWLAVEHFHPEWDVWSQFVVRTNRGTQSAFQLDSLRASHPIEVPVKNALEVDQIFDHISYLKGSSVIRMLSSHLGRETFLRGVASYLKAHAYSNATTNDLWSALSAASNTDVTAFMDPWIRKIGFPLVTVTEEPKQIKVSQKRFLASGDVKPEEDQTTWWIPLGIKSGPQATARDPLNLTVKSDIVRDVGGEAFYKLNKDVSGFYRTNYPAERLAKLGKSLDLLSTQDRIGLIGDAAALAVSGEGKTPALLALLEGFPGEKNYLVWSQIMASLGNLRSVFAGNEEVAAGLKSFVRKLVTPAAENIGWEFKPGEDYLTGQLRQLLVSAAGHSGHEGVIAEAKKRFEVWHSGDKSAIHANLRSPIFSISIAEGGKREFEILQEESQKSDSIDGREICIASLAKSKNTDLVKEFCEFLFSGKVPTQDIHTGAASLAANSKARGLFWEFVKGNYDRIEERLGINKVVFERFLRMGLSKFADHATERDIAKFFEGKDQGGIDRALIIVGDTIRTNANYFERDEKLVLEWLKAHEYV